MHTCFTIVEQKQIIFALKALSEVPVGISKRLMMLQLKLAKNQHVIPSEGQVQSVLATPPLETLASYQ